MSEREARIRNIVYWLRVYGTHIKGSGQVADDIEAVLAEGRTPGPATAAMVEIAKEGAYHLLRIGVDQDLIDTFIAEHEPVKGGERG